MPHAVLLKPSHRRIDPAVSAPLEVGHTDSRFIRYWARPTLRSRDGHSAPPGTVLRNPAKPPPSPYHGWVRRPRWPPARRAQPTSSETCRSHRKAPRCTWPPRIRRLDPPAASPNATAGLRSISHRERCALYGKHAAVPARHLHRTQVARS